MRSWYDLEFDLYGSRMVDPETESRILWIDIETVKVPCSLPDWPSRRWSVFMAGIAAAVDPGVLFLEVRSGGEQELIEWLGEYRDYEFRYCATRRFDEMVLRGRFTNARRAHADVPGPWPHLDYAPIRWLNLRPTTTERPTRVATDIASVDAPHLFFGVPDQAAQQAVARHCLRDVAELLVMDPTVHLSDPLTQRIHHILLQEI